MSRPTCQSCVFFGVAFEHQRWAEAFETCRRLPPAGIEGPGKWPHVHGYDWCGEHKPVSATS